MSLLELFQDNATQHKVSTSDDTILNLKPISFNEIDRLAQPYFSFKQLRNMLAKIWFEPNLNVNKKTTLESSDFYECQGLKKQIIFKIF